MHWTSETHRNHTIHCLNMCATKSTINPKKKKTEIKLSSTYDMDHWPPYPPLFFFLWHSEKDT